MGLAFSTVCFTDSGMGSRSSLGLENLFLMAESLDKGNFHRLYASGGWGGVFQSHIIKLYNGL